jgi:tRNA pseudouridine13 synthase
MLRFLHGEPQSQGKFKSSPEDFKVTERLNFEPSGEGEHLLVEVEKRDANTHYIAKQLADYINVPSKHVTYAGLKDRFSISRQWFGVWLPGKTEVNFQNWHLDEVTILNSVRHNKKLRLGALANNHFEIVLRDVSETDELKSKLNAIKTLGVPNYFGEQRFGRYENNVEQARQMFAGRKVKDKKKRSLYLSAARSEIFNCCVSERITQQKANCVIPGDVLMLSGSRSFFVAEQPDIALQKRLVEGDLQLSAPLVGEGELASQSEALALEQSVLNRFDDLITGLCNARLKQERRALKLNPSNMHWRFDDNMLVLEFELPSGAFATSVLRELIDYQDMS